MMATECAICETKIKADETKCAKCQAGATEKVAYEMQGMYIKGFLSRKYCNFVITNKRFLAFEDLKKIAEMSAGGGLIGMAVGGAAKGMLKKNGKLLFAIDLADVADVAEDKKHSVITTKGGQSYKVTLPKSESIKSALMKSAKSGK
jgi:hypothetical protein